VCCSAVLFDMDGVLVHSTPAVARVWTKWAIQHGFDPREVVAKAHGRPSIATVRDFLPGADHEAENRIVERAEIEDLEGVVPIPGAKELLADLPADRWAIVTSSTKPLAEVRLRFAGLAHPACLVTSSDVVNGKPHPEPYLVAAAKLGFFPADCVVVEDVPAGIQAGKAADCKVIALRTTTSETVLKAAGADWVLDDCRQIAARQEAERLCLVLDA
jgi:mannitol-1-/sugar-/sorbitol-6-phosphatase